MGDRGDHGYADCVADAADVRGEDVEHEGAFEEELAASWRTVSAVRGVPDLDRVVRAYARGRALWHQGTTCRRLSCDVVLPYEHGCLSSGAECSDCAMCLRCLKCRWSDDV